MNESDLNDLKQTIEEIQKLPIFYLSLASRELFHSNFLYWLSTLPKGIDTLKKIFGIDNLSKLDHEINGSQIEGENKKLTPRADLVGYNSDGQIVLVIENKVKDIPNEKQILNLRESFGDNIKYVILSFIEPLFNVIHPVYYVSFENVKDAIVQDIESYNENQYHFELLSDYIRLITNLKKVIDSYNLTGDYDFALSSRNELMKILNAVKLWENYQRLAGQDFSKKVVDCIKTIEGLENLQTVSSVNHQKATIDFYFQWSFFKIGIQIENNQYRRFIYGEITKENADKLRAISLWFNNDWKPKRKLKKLNSEGQVESENGEVKYSYYGSYNMQKKGLSLYQYEPEFSKNYSKNLNEISKKIKDDLLILVEKGNREKIESIMSGKNII